MAKLFCAFAVAGWLIAYLGQAGADDQAGAPSDAAVLFKQLDANGDGQLTDDEAPAPRRKLFKRLLRRADANKDGKLSEAEFLAGMKEDRPEPPAEPPAGAGEAYAQFLKADSDAVFKRLDANGDGKIELTELPDPARARFEQFMENFDVNRDQALSHEEFAKGHALLRAQAGVGAADTAGPGPAAALWRALDRDGDGKLSKDEIAAASTALLALDKDGDGALNRRELMSGPADEPPPAAKTPKAATANLPDPERLLARLRGMDADGDGKWSESELPPFLKKQFKKIDANGDGALDADEVKQAIEVMRRRAEKRAAKAGK